MTTARFVVEVTQESAQRFADLSGDWNPLHTDTEYAAKTTYGNTILHGAFSAGLLSRMAGMELPGRDCLLHGIRLRFVAPIMPPASLAVQGKLVSGTMATGRVDVTISDNQMGTLYVEASYEFGLHTQQESGMRVAEDIQPLTSQEPVVLITGATGGVGGALLERLGNRALGVSRRAQPTMISAATPEQLLDAVGKQPLAAIVHCAWPNPDNRPFIELPEAVPAIDFHVAAPLRYIQTLATLLVRNGVNKAPLVLIGSTFSEPGRHNYRMPLYSLSKSMIPTLVRLLSVELAVYDRRSIGVSFDVIGGGMNRSLNRVGMAAHADRTLFGTIPSPQEVADQLLWVLNNPGVLATGAMLTLSGGAIP